MSNVILIFFLFLSEKNNNNNNILLFFGYICVWVGLNFTQRAVTAQLIFEFVFLQFFLYCFLCVLSLLVVVINHCLFLFW